MQFKKNTVPPSFPVILHQMGLQLSDRAGQVTADRSANWKRIQNDRFGEMFCLGRTWEVQTRPEYVQGIRRALQSITNYHLRNIRLPATLHRFRRLYLNDTCFHDNSVCKNLLYCA